MIIGALREVSRIPDWLSNTLKAPFVTSIREIMKFIKNATLVKKVVNDVGSFYFNEYSKATTDIYIII